MVLGKQTSAGPGWRGYDGGVRKAETGAIVSRSPQAATDARRVAVFCRCYYRSFGVLSMSADAEWIDDTCCCRGGNMTGVGS